MDQRNPILEHDAGDFSPRNLGIFTIKVPGIFFLPLVLRLVPEAFDKEDHSVEHIATSQSMILYLN